MRNLFRDDRPTTEGVGMTWMLWMAVPMVLLTLVVYACLVAASDADDLMDEQWRRERDALRRLSDREDRL